MKTKTTSIFPNLPAKKFFCLAFCLLNFFFFSSSVNAANPTEYQTIHDPYTRVDAAQYPTRFGFSQTYKVLYGGYLPYIRVFIPPGAIMIDMLIEEGGKQMAVARHKIPPTGSPESPPDNYTPNADYKLSDLAASDKWTTESLQGYLYIFHDSFLAPDYLTPDRAGWLYIKVGGGSYSQTYNTQFSVIVDPKTYNDWYDHSGSNPDGSINWERDIESVTTYNSANTNCATETCKGISCYDNSTKTYIKGTKTEGCATGSVSATPTTITAPGSTQITWISTNAKSMEASCSGPVAIPRGGWFINNQTCKDSNLVKECTGQGYQFNFTATQTGQETCIFYPTNSSDNQAGTPFSVMIDVNASATPNPKNADCSAADYVTIHDPYTRVDDIQNPKNYTFSQTYKVLYGGYVPYFRVFIPPGAIVMDLMIQEAGKQMAVAHFQTPPDGSPESQTNNSSPGNKYTLAQLEAGDQWATETLQGDLYISHDSFLPPYLSLARGGWLYVKVGGGSYSQNYFTLFTVQVDTKTYNNWYDHSGSNPDGSINWQKDVEGVCNYTAPNQQATPQKDPSSLVPYTCQPDNSSCAKNTCKNLECFDGCNKIQGTKDC